MRPRLRQQWGARGGGTKEDGEGTLVGMGHRGGPSSLRWGAGKDIGAGDGARLCFDHVQSEALQGLFKGRWQGLWTFRVGT